MKTLLIAMILGLSQLASAQTHPNMLCLYWKVDQTWYSAGAFFSFLGNSIGSSAATMGDLHKAGYAICSTYSDANQNHRMVSYHSDQAFEIKPSTCEIQTAGTYQILEKIEVKPEPGLVTELETELLTHEAKRQKLINYFPTEDELANWTEFDPTVLKANQKCLDLFPGAVPGPGTTKKTGNSLL